MKISFQLDLLYLSNKNRDATLLDKILSQAKSLLRFYPKPTQK